MSDIDKEAAAIATTEVVDEQPEVARRAEINLPKPDKETATTTTATVAETSTTTAAAGELPPQDIVEQQQQPETNQINEDAAERGVSKLQIKTAVVTAKRWRSARQKGEADPSECFIRRSCLIKR